MAVNYKQGSEWRKWDLHIHTPASVLNNGFGNDWDEYVKQLFKKAIANNVYAIGITDYFTIEGYKKIKLEYLKNTSKMQQLFSQEELRCIDNILVLPNIEFRLNKLVGASRINFHVVLSDEISIEDIEENFLHELDFIYEAGPQSDDEKRKLKLRNLEELGNKLIQQHEKFRQHSATFVGMMNAVVDDMQITQLLANKRNIFLGKYLLILPSDEDLSKVSWDAQDHQARKLLLQKADMLMSSNPRTVRWALGKTYEREEDFITEFKTLKPCIWGSDSHNYDELFVKSGERQLWIKADPTFEGLKQILYEPEIRVQISKDNPQDVNKKFFMSGVAVSNSTGFLIGNQVLNINRDLVCVIGGRGSGKSALFECIAYCFDQHNSNRSDSGKRYDSARRLDTDTFIDHFKKKEGCDATFQLHFKDLDGNPINIYTTTLKGRKDLCSLPILYLGQNKIEQFANDPAEIHRLAFDTVIKNTTHADALAATKLAIENKQHQLTQVSKDIETLRGNIRSLDESSLQDEKKRIESELQLLSSEETKAIIASFNSTRLRKDALTQLESLIGEIGVDNPTNPGVLGNALQRFENEIEIIVNHINSYAAALNAEVDTIALDITGFRQSISDLKQKINKNEINGQYNLALQQINEQLKGKTDLSVSYLESQKNRENDVKLKLEQLALLKQNLQEKLDQRELVLGGFSELFNQYALAYSLAINEFVADNSGTLKSVHIDAAVANNIYDLIDKLFDFADKRKARNYDDFVVDFLDIDTTDLTSFDYNVWIRSFKGDLANFDVFNGLTENGFDEIVYANYYSLETKISYEISEGDLKPLNRLSLGQKGTVLLKFYLSSGNNCPIFIDQPEDHLDNDFIYHDLVKTIRAAKIKRQVIMVTHDANLVVNGDADQVIVSKYSDQVISHDFSGSLENPIIRDAVSRTLEGGKEAFQKREQKYQYEFA
jgi:ABC-type lipoprotein export system ATPase subunit